MSRSGVLAAVDDEVAAGERVTVRLLFDQTSEVRLGTVVRGAGDAATGFRVAVEFDKPFPKRV